MEWNIKIPEWKDPIPERYACLIKGYGDNISPSVSWDKVPDAKSYALILQDIHPVADSYIHWYIPSISPDILHIDSLPFHQNAKTNKLDLYTFYKKHPEMKVRQGINTHRDVGYFGPCPPRGSGKHIYVFRLMALDHDLNEMGIENLYETHHFKKFDQLLQSQNVKIICEKTLRGTFQK
jgi:Raf kinase inhibitor-like YbhB/YbcL family protein